MSSPADETDQALIERAKIDREAFGALFERHFSSVFGYVWIPITKNPTLRAGADLLASRTERWVQILARMKPGVTSLQAAAEVAALTAALDETFPARRGLDSRDKAASRVTVFPLGNGDPAMRRDLMPVATVVLVMAGLVLLIACGNVANLLLSRAATREREIAMRVTLGATRARVMRQLLTEGLVLALVSGAVAIVAAVWVANALVHVHLPISAPTGQTVPLDGRVFGYALSVSIVAGLACSLAPALRASRPNLMPLLNAGQFAGQRRGRRFSLQSALVVFQVSVSVVLLSAALLLTRSLFVARQIDAGFRTEGLLTATIDVGLNNYSEPRGREFYRGLLERVRATPGVRSASLVHPLPLAIIGDENEGKRPITLPADPSSPPTTSASSPERRLDAGVVDPGYFATMRIALTGGRDFSERDGAGTAPVAIVNETMARRLWPGRNAVGRQFSLTGPQGPFIEIVGVARDSKYRTLGEPGRPYIYLPAAQHYRPAMSIVVETTGDPAAFAASLREVVSSQDPAMATLDVATITDRLHDALFLPRAAAALFGTTGALGLILAISGLYGVVSYAVTRRRREIGIRIALGAPIRLVRRMIVNDGLRLAVLGCAIGLPMALAAGSALAAVLYGLTPRDPVTFAGVLVLITAVAGVASYVPARRASSVSPAKALRTG